MWKFYNGVVVALRLLPTPADKRVRIRLIVNVVEDVFHGPFLTLQNCKYNHGLMITKL